MRGGRGCPRAAAAGRWVALDYPPLFHGRPLKWVRFPGTPPRLGGWAGRAVRGPAPPESRGGGPPRSHGQQQPAAGRPAGGRRRPRGRPGLRRLDLLLRPAARAGAGGRRAGRGAPAPGTARVLPPTRRSPRFHSASLSASSRQYSLKSPQAS